ncbi:MAG: ABC transporter substrate-binding protein [Bacteroidetes bacterium QS_3_64_15]|nr:MAG: ABC transporter substrate-binding protein [Bacteroidetes bacterium QS_3_64_15]
MTQHQSTPLRSFVAGLSVLALLAVGLVGCSGDDQGASRQMDMVTVNWIEGMAMTYMQEQILENRYDMEVDIREVQGGGTAFVSVASGDRDFFNEAWLPTTHEQPWKENQDGSKKLGYTYRGTSVGVVVPAYVEADTFPDLTSYQQELDGTLNGIESGAAINDQMENTLELYDMNDAFSVSAASGPANWQALESAIGDNEPIAVAGWKPHWKWNRFDIKYVNGAKTGHNVDIWGQPEDIFTIVGDDFIDKFPREVVCFLQEFEANDEQVGSLMSAFNERGDMSKEEAAAQWIENNPDDVEQWMNQAEECANSDEELEYLPDDATYSTDQAEMSEQDEM